MNLDNTQYVLEMDHITKEYSGNQVLKGVNLHIKPGEIHALMGENGAGKSTLMNILFGMPVIHSTGGFGGSVKMAGQPVNIDTPLKAMELGIGMVHQEFMLIPGFTVTENIKIGREISTPNLVSRIFGKSMESLDAEAMAKDAKKALKTIGLQIEDYVKVAGLPVGYMQFIEIAREIDKTGIRLLVFDEPTAVLTESEADRLLEAMRVIASQGIAIIFITHRLDEVMAVADGMTILRDGEFVAHREIKDTNVVEIAELMIGRKVEKLVDTSEEDRRIINDTNIAVSMKDYYVDMPGEQVKGINLDIRKGEIFGIGGLAGQGKLGIPNGIMGLYKAEGQVMINGEPLNLEKLGCALEHKIAFVSEDRKGVGLLPVSYTHLERVTGHIGTETRPNLLREAAVGNIAQWLSFAMAIQKLLVKNEACRLAGLYIFWNMVDGREKTDLYTAYDKTIKELELPLMKTFIPDTKRYKKELVADRKAVFRSTLFPASRPLVRGSNLEELITEITYYIKLQ